MADAIRVGEISTKRKEAKEKSIVQKPIANRPIGNSTIGRVADVSSPPSTEVHTVQAIEHKQLALEQTELARAERRSQSIKTLEIDEYLLGLVMEGILDEDWFAWAAGACNTLGLQHVNRIVQQVREAKCDPAKGQSKHKLLSWKLNGAIQLHFKKQFYADRQAGASPERVHEVGQSER